MKTTKKVLYFEGAGWSGADISKATVGNCRIRTAFHLDDGRAVYLEIIACETTKNSPAAWRHFKYAGFVDDCHYISNDDEGIVRYPRGQFAPFEYNHAGILAVVNSLGASFDDIEVLPNLGGYRVHAADGGYNFGDQFQADRNLIAAREAVDVYLLERERQRTGRKSPAYSLWVDDADPAILHFNSHNGIKFDICVAMPKSMESLPVLDKTTAIPGCYYAWCNSYQITRRVYRISEDYAEENDLMFLDRVETSVADFALPGSDIYRKGGC
ncbi:MAG: hypothetical protein IJB11_05535 [Oscillospiraceae bacterium]|nr:hypothetical protein [Oscillospiraceae bacterium]